MRQGAHPPSRRALHLLALPLLLVPASSPAAESCGAPTPEAVFDRAAAALEAGDVAGLVACVEPASQRETAKELLVASTMIVAFSAMEPAMADTMAEGMAEVGGAVEPSQEAEEQRAELDAQVAEFRALLVEYGLPDFDPASAETAPEVDLDGLLAEADAPALIADLLGFLGAAVGEGPPLLSAEEVGELRGLVVDGDRARGTAGGQDLAFVRVDGLWWFAPSVVTGSDPAAVE